MAEAQQYVVFTLDGQRFAIAVSQVRQALAAAEPTPLPGAPSVVIGMLDLHGEVVAIYDVRRRAAVAPALRARDQFLVISFGTRTLALVVQEVVGVFALDVDALALEAGPVGDAPAAEGFGGWDAVARLQGDLILIHDAWKFLSGAEAAALDAALEAAREAVS